MEPNTLTAIAVFLTPFLIKAGEKVSEKTVETLFDSRKDIAEKFSGLFKDEIMTLGLSESSTAEEVTKRLKSKPELEAQIEQMIADNQDLLNKLAEALTKQEGRTITCRTYIENIEKINSANFR